jgi:aldose 1-epimerase
MKFLNLLIKGSLILLPVYLPFSCGAPVNKSNEPVKNDTSMVKITKSDYGKVDGEAVYLFTLTAKDGTKVSITNYGGIVTSLFVPDRHGNMGDVVLGFDSLQGYLKGHPYFGCIVGRCANRIAGAKFELEGKTYQLAKNIGENHLHGGNIGFDKKVWDAREIKNGDDAGVELTYISPDGEEGYPGELKVIVTYTLTQDRELKIKYFAESTKPTPINLTYHGYFNLKGAGNGDILGHQLMINADRYNVISDQLLPTGELRSVTGTPMDFRQPKLIGLDMARVEGGYDHNFALNVNKDGSLIRAAVLSESSTGRWMEVYTTQPGMQLYCGNFLDGTIIGKNGKPYFKHYALCLETQHFPDSPNHPEFPNTILRPGEKFTSETVYKFGTNP